jgi:hypothetical protein
MSISPKITLRLAKSRLDSTAVPLIVPLAVFRSGLASVGHHSFSDGISFDKQPIIRCPADFYSLKIFRALGVARRQRTEFNLMLRHRRQPMVVTQIAA